MQALLSSLVLLLYSAASLAETSSTFHDLLIKEVQNRATARVLMSKMARVRQKNPDGVFWDAYKRLEEFNYQAFEPISTAFDVSLDAGVKSRLFAAVSSVALRVMPQFILESVYERTREYVGQLESLYRLSPAEHKAFFDYVVRQEKAQLIAMKHAVNKNYGLAAEVIDDFVTLNSQNKEK